MLIELDKKHKNFPQNHIVSKLSKFFIEKPWGFRMVDQIDILKGLINETEEEIINRVFNDLKNIFEIEDKELVEFKDLWLQADNNCKGDLLEYVISNLGAYHFSHSSASYVNESRVYSIKKDDCINPINRLNDLDVVFFCNRNSIVENKRISVCVKNGVEFHEAKKNVTNEIPANLEKDPNKRMKNKLELMRDIYLLYPEGKYFIPTFSSYIRPCQQYLDAHGYGFIEIISVNQLLSRYFKKVASD